MQWKRPHHTRWLIACVAGLLLAVLAGGFSAGLAVMFVIIFAAGAAVLSLGGLGPLDGPLDGPLESAEPDDHLTPNGEPPPA